MQAQTQAHRYTEIQTHRHLGAQTLALTHSLTHSHTHSLTHSLNRCAATIRTAIQNQVPFKVIVDNMSSRSTASKDNMSGLHLLSLVLANDMVPTEPLLEEVGLSMRAFFQILTANLTFKSRSVFRTAAFVCGMLLNVFSSQGEARLLEDLTREVLGRLEPYQKDNDATSKERLVTCLHQLCNVNTGHPPIVDHFAQRLLFLAPSLPGQFKVGSLVACWGRARVCLDLRACCLFFCL